MNDKAEPGVEQRHRNMLIIWAGILMVIPMYLVLIWINSVPPDPEKTTLSLMLIGLSIVPVAISFLVKQKLLAKAADLHKLDLVQQAYVVAFVLCEAALLLGLITYFVTGSPYYVAAIAIGALGILLHFPRKQHLLDATFKGL
ncbi:MAG TPA: hypothetical protein VFX97_09200 [Pyrinomonadaceae bacterium]|nr:hypothetical protein [Pyrinomonadaceae bacterium]